MNSQSNVNPKLPATSNDPRWIMRWILFFTFLMALLVALLAGIILAYQARSPIPLVLPSPFLAAMRPIINYLFGAERKV